MVRKQAQQPVKQRAGMYEGAGEVQLKSLLLGEEEMNGKGRLFSKITLPVGASIGHHVHEGESETFYILRGQGEFDDNGSAVPFEAGDLLFTASGEGHGLKNTGAEPLELVAMILYA